MPGTIITSVGSAKLANAIATGTPLQLSQMAVGDGNGSPVSPSAGATALVRERHRAPINDIYIDPNNSQQVIAEIIIPSDVGGWTAREVGVFDSTGAMIAYGSITDRYKALADEGETLELGIRVVMKVSDASAVVLNIDPAITLAPRKWVTDNFLSRIGGTTHQILRKKSNADNDVEWHTPDYSGDAVRDDLAVDNDPIKGSAMVGHEGKTVRDSLLSISKSIGVNVSVDMGGGGTVNLHLDDSGYAGYILYNTGADSILLFDPAGDWPNYEIAILNTGTNDVVVKFVGDAGDGVKCKASLESLSYIFVLAETPAVLDRKKGMATESQLGTKIAGVTHVTDSSYSPTTSVVGHLFECDNAGGVAFEVPANSSQPFNVGETLNICKAGSGDVDISGAVGVTFNKRASASLTISEEGDTITLVKTATDTWRVIG